MQVAAAFMIFFSLFGKVLLNCSSQIFMQSLKSCITESRDVMFVAAAKFGAIFASVPSPIVAALFCVLFGKVGMLLHLASLINANIA